MSDAAATAKKPVGASGPDLAGVMEWARRALAWGGLQEVADRAAALLTAPPPSPTLVVIGEVKRGKSSLVNALLGRPGASPVDVEITTSAFLRFLPATDSNTEGDTTLVYAGGRRQPIDNADMADWVTVDGRRVTDPNVEELPLGAEVVVRGLFLPRLTVVDTPGVGGLNPNHLRLSTMATEQATMLLMTCDATAPITGPELDFLKAVSGEVDAVVIAVTKIDKNLRHWRSIIEENRRLLREHAPRFADVPMFGVSSLDATAALTMEPGEQRDTALQESGLPQLVACLNAIGSKNDYIHTANALRTARTGLERIGQHLTIQRSAMVGTTTRAELTNEQQRLDELRKKWESGWRDYLARDLNAVQRTTLGHLDHKLEALKSTWRKRLEAAKLEVLRRTPQLFVADMTADVEVVIREVSDELVAAVLKLVSNLQLDGEVAVGGLTTPEVHRDDAPHSRKAGLLDPQTMWMGVLGSRLLGGSVVSGLGLTAFGAAVALPVTLAVGGAWVAVNLGFRAVRMGRANLLQWLNTTISAVNKDTAREIQERVDTIRPVIFDEYRQHLTHSMEQLKKVIAAADTAAKASGTEQAKALKDLDTRRDAVNQIMAGIDAQLSRFAPRASAVPP
jgi:GTPase SAR1 family protein